MKKLCFLLSLLLLWGCGGKGGETPPQTEVTETFYTQPPATEAPDPIRLQIGTMSLEDRVGQLFLASCREDSVLSDIENYHLGGLLFFAADFQNETPDSLRLKLASYQQAAKIPLLLAVDEEGGTVTRISRFPAFRAGKFPSPRTAFQKNGMESALENEVKKAQFLRDLGLNVNLGPVVDLATQKSAFMYARSLGQDALTTAAFAAETVAIQRQYGIGSALKHFPGYGNNADTHTGIAVDSRSLDALKEQDLLPFSAGIEAGADCILVSHTIVEALDPKLPASLSPEVHRYLRENLGFDGVILTDDLAMQAITEQFGAQEAAVQAILAGNDLLCATDFPVQYEAVLQAVLDGRISIDLLNAAVTHVLEWKHYLNLI